LKTNRYIEAWLDRVVGAEAKQFKKNKIQNVSFAQTPPSFEPPFAP